VRIVFEAIAQFPDELYAKILERFPGINKSMGIEEMMAVSMAYEAIYNRNPRAYKELMDRRYGKVVQGVEPHIPDEETEFVVIKTYPSDLKNDIIR